MYQILFNIISYGALIFLWMPRTLKGVLLAVSVFAVGCGLIVYRKGFRMDLRKNGQGYILPLSAYICMCFAFAFYNRWISSLVIQKIADILHLHINTLLVACGFTMSVLSVFFVHALVQFVVPKVLRILPKNTVAGNILYSLCFAAATTAMAQIMMAVPVFPMGYYKFAMGVLIVWTTILLLYCIFGNILPSIFIGSGIFMIISTINVYVFRFRSRLFEPIDIFSAQTALNVADNYSLFPIPQSLFLCWGFFAVALIVLYGLQHKTKAAFTLKKRIALLIACAVSFGVIFPYTHDLTTYHWKEEGALFNGYVLDFTAKFKEISAPKPEGYTLELIDDLAEQYSHTGDADAVSETPHLIVIMNEAFSDLRVLGDFSTNQEVTPFISSLKENTVSGYALASVYGGNTANSEYEFFTGHSFAWLSPNAVPYQQYIRSATYAMPSYLKMMYGYKCLAMHPYGANGWNRPAAYDCMGFDTCYFWGDFPRQNLVREYVSDQEMFEFLIDAYEEQKEDPLFIFGVTMQNHGGYTYEGDNYTKHITLDSYGEEYPDVEQYLSLIHETDKAVEYLISYFQDVQEDVVIVFFGDHQPRIKGSFYETLNAGPAQTLDDQQKEYIVPFFIWTNYETESQWVSCTSLNYLSSYVYDAAGLAMPPYNRFLREMEEVIPSINAFGFYSSDKGCYLPFAQANETEREWLKQYEYLQYNNIFDKKHQNETFFPALK